MMIIGMINAKMPYQNIQTQIQKKSMEILSY